MRRLVLSLATVLVAGGAVLGVAGVASAGSHAKPVITATQVSFTIPASPAGVWQLGLTTYPPPVTHLGKVQGGRMTALPALPRLGQPGRVIVAIDSRRGDGGC